MSNQLTLFNPTMPYIPMFNAKCQITPEMEARFADVYKKRVRQEGHKGSLPPDMTVSKPTVKVDAQKISSPKTKKEVILSLFQEPILRKDFIRKAIKLGIPEGTARHHMDGLEQSGIIKRQRQVVTEHGKTDRVLYVATGRMIEDEMPYDAKVLDALATPKTRTDLAELLGIRKRTIETITDRLEKHGRIKWTGETTKGRHPQKFWQRVDL